jgi:hypothetical protein
MELGIPCSGPNLDPITKVFVVHNIIDAKQYEMVVWVRIWKIALASVT